GSVEQYSQIKLPLDPQSFLNEQRMNGAAFRTRLGRDQIHSDHLLRQVVNIFRRAREFDAAALAAAARVDLRFDDHGQSQLFGGLFGLADRTRDPAARDLDLETAQQFLTLILVNLHRNASVI